MRPSSKLARKCPRPKSVRCTPSPKRHWVSALMSGCLIIAPCSRDTSRRARRWLRLLAFSAPSGPLPYRHVARGSMSLHISVVAGYLARRYEMLTSNSWNHCHEFKRPMSFAPRCKTRSSGGGDIAWSSRGLSCAILRPALLMKVTGRGSWNTSFRVCR